MDFSSIPHQLYTNYEYNDPEYERKSISWVSNDYLYSVFHYILSFWLNSSAIFWGISP